MKRRWMGLILLIAGILAISYGFFNWYTAKSSVEALTITEMEELDRAQEKDNIIKEKPLFTSLDLEKSLEPILTTSILLTPGEEIASLIIPKLEQKYSVYWGADETTLKQGVGMFISNLTTVPGGNGHTVLSGHRDTVFTGLGELAKKDLLMMEYDGEVYVYEVTKTWITHEDDRSVIVEKDDSILTLTTCYPFDYIGYAAERYIVEARLVSASST